MGRPFPDQLRLDFEVRGEDPQVPAALFAVAFERDERDTRRRPSHRDTRDWRERQAGRQ